MAGSRPTTMNRRPCGRSIETKWSSRVGTDGRDGDRVEVSAVRQAQRVGSLELDVANAARRELGSGRCREFGKDVDARDSLREPRETGREIAAAGSDDERLVDGLDLKGLQNAALDLRRQHSLPIGERDLGVREREVAVFARDEILARRLCERA